MIRAAYLQEQINKHIEAINYHEQMRKTLNTELEQELRKDNPSLSSEIFHRLTGDCPAYGKINEYTGGTEEC